jgi:hypothetical protein
MTKNLKLKANELKKREDYLRAKQVKIEENEEYWREKKE